MRAKNPEKSYFLRAPGATEELCGGRALVVGPVSAARLHAANKGADNLREVH